MNYLENKAVIITGGTSGIGEGIAKHCAAQGAGIVLSGRDAAKGERIE